MLRVYFVPTDPPACSSYHISPSCLSSPCLGLLVVPDSHSIELGRRHSVTRRGNITGTTSLMSSRGASQPPAAESLISIRRLLCVRPAGRLSTQGQVTLLSLLRPTPRVTTCNHRRGGTAACARTLPGGTLEKKPRCASHPRGSSLDFPATRLVPSPQTYTYTPFWHLKVRRARRRRI